MTRRVLALFSVPVVTLAIAMPPVAASQTTNETITFSGWGSGGGINLELAPQDLQECFGSDGFFNWQLNEGVARLTRLDPGDRGLFELEADLTLSIQNVAGEVVSTVTEHVLTSVVSGVDPATGNAEVVTPVRKIKLAGLDGHKLKVTMLFVNGIHISQGVLRIDFVAAVPEYSNIECK